MGWLPTEPPSRFLAIWQNDDSARFDQLEIVQSGSTEGTVDNCDWALSSNQHLELASVRIS